MAAHRRDGYIAVRVTDTTDWSFTAFQVLGGDKALAGAIRAYTKKKWHRGVAS